MYSEYISKIRNTCSWDIFALLVGIRTCTLRATKNWNIYNTEIIKLKEKTKQLKGRHLEWGLLSHTTIQAMDVYVKRDMETRSCNHCCSRKAINITYFESVFVAFFPKWETRMRHIFNVGLSGYTVFFPTSFYKRHNLRKKKLLDTDCVFWFIYAICPK